MRDSIHIPLNLARLGRVLLAGLAAALTAFAASPAGPPPASGTFNGLHGASADFIVGVGKHGDIIQMGTGNGAGYRPGNSRTPTKFVPKLPSSKAARHRNLPEKRSERSLLAASGVKSVSNPNSATGRPPEGPGRLLRPNQSGQPVHR